MPSKAREEATKLAVNLIKDLLPKSNNAELTKQRLDSLSDKEFDELMTKFANEEDFLQVIVPVMDDNNRVTYDDCHKVANKYKIDLYSRVWLTEQDGSSELSNKKSLILYLPLKVQQQLNSKKMSIPKNNDNIDHFTGQVTGKDSKGSRLSYPEVNTLLAMGLTKTVEEFMHFRGGSEKGVKLIEQSVMNNGMASADALKPYSGNVGSTMMLHSYLTAMMLRSTLLAK